MKNKFADKIPEKDWVSSKVEIKKSPLGGKGMFAKDFILPGEKVIIWGGTRIFTKQDIDTGKTRPHSVAGIDEGLYLAGAADEPAEETDFTNHSCDSNLWMKDAVTLIAKREIKPGEEITADYALWEGDENWKANWECHCGSRFCRHKITGQDWKIPEVQERYKDHFSTFINKRIEGLAKKKNLL